MFTEKDIAFINQRGSVLKDVEVQIENFKKGFPFLKLESAATPKDGILVLNDDDAQDLTNHYDQLSTERKIVKFVPASGAASRMFKLLFGFLEVAANKEEATKQVRESDGLQSIGAFFKRIKDFAFFDDLNEELQKNHSP